jgi:hypothetical protein
MWAKICHIHWWVADHRNIYIIYTIYLQSKYWRTKLVEFLRVSEDIYAFSAEARRVVVGAAFGKDRNSNGLVISDGQCANLKSE